MTSLGATLLTSSKDASLEISALSSLDMEANMSGVNEWWALNLAVKSCKLLHIVAHMSLYRPSSEENIDWSNLATSCPANANNALILMHGGGVVGATTS